MTTSVTDAAGGRGRSAPLPRASLTALPRPSAPDRREKARSALLSLLLFAAAGGAGAATVVETPDPLSVTGPSLGTLLEPDVFDADLTLAQRIHRHFSIGRISGSRNAVIFPAIKLFGKTITSAVRGDTRTGTRLDLDMDVGNSLKASTRFSIGRWATGLTVHPQATIPTFYADGFFSLDTRTRLGSYSPDFDPRFQGSLGFGLDQAFKVGLKALLLGKGIDTSALLGFAANVTLFDVSIDRLGADLKLPTSPVGDFGLPIPGFSSPIAADVPGNDILKRFTFGGTNQIVTVDVLNPLSEKSSSYRTFSEGDSAGFRTRTSLLRAGVDLLGLAGAAVGVPTQLHKRFGNLSLDLAPASVDLQAQLGIGLEGRVTPELRADLTNTSDNTLFVRDASGVTALAPGQTLHDQRWDALPEFSASAPVDLAVHFTDLAVTQELTGKAQITPMLSLNIPKSLSIKKNGKPLPLLKKRGPLVSLSLSGDTSEFELGHQQLSVDDLGLSGSGLSLHLAPETPKFARAAGSTDSSTHSIEGLNSAARAIPPHTSCVVLWYNYIWCDKNHNGSLDSSNELVTQQERDAFEQQQNALRAQILNDRNAPRFTDEATKQEFGVGRFIEDNYALQVNDGEDLTLVDTDFSQIFGQVHVAALGRLRVENLDGAPSEFEDPERGIPLIRNDGSLVITQGSDPARLIVFSDQQPVRTFTGRGETRFELGGSGPQTGSTVRMGVADGGILINDSQHTMRFVNGSGVRFGSPSTVGGAALVNLGELDFEGTRVDIVLGGTGVSESEWAAGPPNRRHTTNSGTLRASRNAGVLLLNLEQLENSGDIIAESGADVRLQGVARMSLGSTRFGESFTDPQLNLWNDGRTVGRMLADGAGSSFDIDGRVRLRAGSHLFAARNGAQMDIADGIGRRYTIETPDAGVATLEVGAGALMQIGGLARFDGSVRVEAGGTLALNGLASRTERGLSIENAGLLDLLSGVHGPLPQPTETVVLPYNPDGSTPPPPPERVATVEPLDFKNTGTVRIHSQATLGFMADVTDYAFDGVAFEGGTWDLSGGKMVIGLRDLRLDPQLFPNGGATTLPDPATVKITHNRADVSLRLNADFKYAFVDGVDDLPDVMTNGTDYLSYLTTNEGRLTLDAHHGTILNDFDNSGRETAYGPGELLLKNSARLDVAGTFGNLSGQVRVESGSTLNASSGYRIEGGTLSVSADSRLGGIEDLAGGGARIAAGRRFEIADHSTVTTDANGNETTVVDPGVLDLQGRSITGIAGEVLLSGADARFDALTGLTRIDAGGRLSLDFGATLSVGTDADVRSGLDNFGTLEIRNGSVLSVYGDYVEQVGGLTLLESGGLLQADRWIIADGQSIHINGTAKTDIDASGADTRIGGSGRMFGNFSLHDGAGINPGNSPGTLDVFGDLSLDDGARLTTEIAGFGTGAFDRLNLFGDLLLGQSGDGALWTFDFTGLTDDPLQHLDEAVTVLVIDEIVDANGNPLLDNQGNPMGPGEIDGWFSSIDFLGLNGFSLAYQPGGGLGDRMLLGRNGLLDLLLVRDQQGSQTRFDLVFSRVAPSGVPEPGSVPLLTAGLLVLVPLLGRRANRPRPSSGPHPDHLPPMAWAIRGVS